MTLLLLLLACGRAVPVDAGTPGAGFPHPDGYEEAIHGLDAVATGARCGDCHASATGGLVNGAASAAPACQDCHTWPHPDGFEAGAEHGPAWAAPEAECTNCHGADGAREPAGIAAGRCGSCHSTYPHTKGWTEAAAHGAAVLARGTDAACTSCHGDAGDALSGKESGKACGACHTYPHPDGWGAGAGHGAAWRAASTKEGAKVTACGESCHPVAHDPTAGDPAAARLTCQGCHDVYPHAPDLLAGHVALTQSRGSAACAACHAGGDAAGPPLPVSCAPACHGEGARTATGSAPPASRGAPPASRGAPPAAGGAAPAPGGAQAGKAP